MTRNKMIGLMAMMLLLSVGAVSAATTFTTPGASATMRGATAIVNITTADLVNLTNCTFTASSVLTGDSLAATTATNASAEATWVNTTIDTTAMEDANDWVFAGICYNASTNATITSRTGVTIDNTVPAAATSLTVANVADENNVGTWSATVTDASTTECSMYVTNGGTTTKYTMTYSGTSCTYSSYLTLQLQYAPTWIVETGDGTNYTNTSSTSVGLIDTKSGGGGSGTAVHKTGDDESRSSIIGDLVGEENKPIVIVLALVLLVYGYTAGWFNAKGSSTTKRRSRRKRK